MRPKSSGFNTQGHEDTILFETVNVTGGGKLHGRLGETSADVVMFQEHHWPGDRIAEERGKLVRAGWQATLAAACQSPLSDSGTNGGVGMAATSGLNFATIQGLCSSVEWPPEHRFTFKVLNALLPHGILVGSAYLTTGIGYAGVNVSFFAMLGQVLRAMNRPFILGGDFNMARSSLTEAGWLRAVRAEVVGPPGDEPTFVDGFGKGSAIDFFIVSDVLMPFVRGSWVDRDPTCVRGHRPTCLRMAVVKLDTMVTKIRRPAVLPTLLPVGPRGKPPDYTNLLSKIGGADSDEVSLATLDELTTDWGNLSEVELLGIHNVSGERKHQNLLGMPRLVKVQAIRAHRPSPHAGGEADLWHFIADRLRQLHFLRFGEGSANEDTFAKRASHVQGLERRLASRQWQFTKPQSHLWITWRAAACSIAVLASVQLQVLWQMLEAEAKSLEKEASAARALSWKNWAATTAMANGARLAHRFTRVATPAFPTHVAPTGEPLSPQEQADAAAAPWHKLWTAYRFRPPIDLRDAIRVQPIEVPPVKVIRSTANTLSRFTAIGTDHMHARHIESLCDEAVEALSRGSW